MGRSENAPIGDKLLPVGKKVTATSYASFAVPPLMTYVPVQILFAI